MRSSSDGEAPAQQGVGGLPEEELWECAYCGNLRTSPNGTGSDVACCGEVGHVQAQPVKVLIGEPISVAD